jgi:hypothetical protein
MYKEGYLGTLKLLVGLVKENKVQLVVLNQLYGDRQHSYATSVELRHAAKMLTEAADQLDK